MNEKVNNQMASLVFSFAPCFGIFEIKLKMSAQETKRQRVSDLDAQINPKTIASIVGVSERTIRNVRTAKNEGKGVLRKKGSGGNGLKCNNEFLVSLRAKIKKDPTISMRRLADIFSVEESTIRKAVHDDLSLQSYICTPRLLLTTKMKAGRLKRCKKVLMCMKHSPAIVRIFSDKKIFTIDQVLNHRND